MRDSKKFDQENLIKRHNVKITRNKSISRHISPNDDFKQSMAPLRNSNNSSNQSIGIKIAQKLLSQPKAKPLIVKGTMR
jgi:hypothetical protein